MDDATLMQDKGLEALHRYLPCFFSYRENPGGAYSAQSRVACRNSSFGAFDTGFVVAKNRSRLQIHQPLSSGAGDAARWRPRQGRVRRLALQGCGTVYQPRAIARVASEQICGTGVTRGQWRPGRAGVLPLGQPKNGSRGAKGLGFSSECPCHLGVIPSTGEHRPVRIPLCPTCISAHGAKTACFPQTLETLWNVWLEGWAMFQLQKDAFGGKRFYVDSAKSLSDQSIRKLLETNVGCFRSTRARLEWDTRGKETLGKKIKLST